MAIDYDLIDLDDDGYPLDETLDYIQQVKCHSAEDCEELLDVIGERLWYGGDCFKRIEKGRYILYTIGWSGTLILTRRGYYGHTGQAAYSLHQA